MSDPASSPAQPAPGAPPILVCRDAWEASMAEGEGWRLVEDVIAGLRAWIAVGCFAPGDLGAAQAALLAVDEMALDVMAGGHAAALERLSEPELEAVTAGLAEAGADHLAVWTDLCAEVAAAKDVPAWEAACARADARHDALCQAEPLDDRLADWINEWPTEIVADAEARAARIAAFLEADTRLDARRMAAMTAWIDGLVTEPEALALLVLASGMGRPVDLGEIARVGEVTLADGETAAGRMLVSRDRLQRAAVTEDRVRLLDEEGRVVAKGSLDEAVEWAEVLRRRGVGGAVARLLGPVPVEGAGLNMRVLPGEDAAQLAVVMEVRLGAQRRVMEMDDAEARLLTAQGTIADRVPLEEA